MERNYNHNETWTEKTGLYSETSAGVERSEKEIEVKFTVGVSDEAGYGYFEFYDLKTGGEEWYADGGLWFTGKKLTDYDGVFSLCNQVKNKLKEWGYDISDME